MVLIGTPGKERKTNTFVVTCPALSKGERGDSNTHTTRSANVVCQKDLIEHAVRVCAEQAAPLSVPSLVHIAGLISAYISQSVRSFGKSRKSEADTCVRHSW